MVAQTELDAGEPGHHPGLLGVVVVGQTELDVVEPGHHPGLLGVVVVAQTELDAGEPGDAHVLRLDGNCHVQHQPSCRGFQLRPRVDTLWPPSVDHPCHPGWQHRYYCGSQKYWVCCYYGAF